MAKKTHFTSAQEWAKGCVLAGKVMEVIEKKKKGISPRNSK